MLRWLARRLHSIGTPNHHADSAFCLPSQLCSCICLFRVVHVASSLRAFAWMAQPLILDGSFKSKYHRIHLNSASFRLRTYPRQRSHLKAWSCPCPRGCICQTNHTLCRKDHLYVMLHTLQNYCYQLVKLQQVKFQTKVGQDFMYLVVLSLKKIWGLHQRFTSTVPWWPPWQLRRCCSCKSSLWEGSGSRMRTL